MRAFIPFALALSLATPTMAATLTVQQVMDTYSMIKGIESDIKAVNGLKAAKEDSVKVIPASSGNTVYFSTCGGCCVIGITGYTCGNTTDDNGYLYIPKSALIDALNADAEKKSKQMQDLGVVK